MSGNNLVKENSNLKEVHKLYAIGEYDKALSLLESLANKHPDFNIYQLKIKECKSKIGKNKNRGQSFQSDNSPLKNGDTEIVIKADISQKTGAARKLLQEKYKKNPNEDSILIELARLDIIDNRFSDALHKAKVVLTINKNNRDAYKIAEQAAIELGRFDEANYYFLSQPPVVNPPTPRKRGLNPVLPKQFKVPSILGPGNDYRHILEKSSLFKSNYTKKVSIIIPVYNRHKILANTLAALTHQTYPSELMEAVVVDDGSNDAVFDIIKKYENKLNIYYVRQADYGYRLAAARNIGIRCSTGDAIIFMDADILPCPEDVESYMKVLHVSDQVVLIGHRRYVDVSNINDNDILQDIKVATKLPNINPNNDVADRKNAEGISIDWRYPVYEKNNFLIDDIWPFTKAAGGNIAFSRTLLNKAGFVDEDFQAWGCEDGEHGYRLYNAGAYFIPMLNIVSLHQEPLDEMQVTPGTDDGESFRAIGHKITKQIFAKKCPAPTVRQYLTGLTFDVPKVSIYIPAYNAGRYIVEAIQSCLDQNFDDLEVCICDDGSTDNTLELLVENFSNNKKVRFVTQENGGIGNATNTAINLCRGMYIAQLDADDRLKQNAVRSCVSVLDHKDIDAVYTDCDYIDSDGQYIRDGWCGGEFSRDWMATGMIATHFRMFRKRVWSRISGCNEKIKNAVDLDLWLKIYERGNIEHIHQILHSYRWHGENTSVLHRKHQERNHLKVVSDSLKRLNLDVFWAVKSTDNPLNPREFMIKPNEKIAEIIPRDIVFLIPTCEKYQNKTEAVRQTWAKNLGSFGFRYLFLMGNPMLRNSEVVGDILFVPCRDDYESLLLKLVLGYQFLYRTMPFSYVYKIDDDCFPDLKKLVDVILPQLAGNQYLGGATHPKGSKMNAEWHFGKCSSPKFDKPYRFDVAPFEFAKGGYGYFLRRDILPMLMENITLFREELDDGVYSFEDVRIAEVLCSFDIHPVKIKNYNVSKFSNEIPRTNYLVYDIADPSIFHELEKSTE